MQDNYSYPFDETWTQADIVTVIALYNAVEQAYESGVRRDEFLQKISLISTGGSHENGTKTT